MAKAKGTKAIAARIPYESYIELLDDAQGRGMTMNEYVSWRIFRQLKEEGKENSKIKELEDQLESIKHSLDAVKRHVNMYTLGYDAKGREKEFLTNLKLVIGVR